ncbi:MAG: Gfo/Idh/MocA family protein, partial [Bacilli bacterium]
MLNFVLVGFGGMGSYHLELLNQENIFNIYGVYDIDSSKTEVAEKLGYKAFNSLEEVCEDGEVDVVLVATPNDTHLYIATKLMEAKKHVICEKPVGLSKNELESMISTSIKNGVKFTVNQNRRYDTDFLTAKSVIEAREIGDTFKIQSNVMGSRGIPGDWRGREENGGGMLFDWGIHMIDQALLMIDQSPESLYCKFTHATNEEVDDGFDITLNYSSGLIFNISCSTCNFLENNRWNIFANNGSAYIKMWQEIGETIVLESWDDVDVKPIKASSGFTKTMAKRIDGDNKLVKKSIKFQKADCKDIYRNFSNAVKGSDELVITHDSLLETMNVLEKCFESVKTNRV